MKSLKRLLLNSLFVSLLAAGTAWCGQMTGGDFVMTKDLLGAAGPADNPTIESTDYSLAYAWGEPISGDVISEPVAYTIISGYYGGRFGNWQTFTMMSSQVGTTGNKTFFQDQTQVGVPFNAPVQLTFSDQLDPTTTSNGIQAVIITDHLGQSSNASAAITIDPPDPVAHTVTIHPQTAWLGNTLYDIQVSPALLSVDGFQLDQIYHVYFVTMLDPHQDNVVLNPIAPSATGSAASVNSISAMSIQIPAQSLSDYSAVLLSRDPLHAPLRVDPKIIQAADDKARASGGDYRVPLSIQEISAYDTQGNVMGPLAQPADVTINYSVGAGPSLVRPSTLSLWVLDEVHELWVKIPASQNTLNTVSAPVAYFSVYALMGSQDGSAQDSFVFPVPWRPHGPNAGTGPGQTGTETDGLTFSNIPSECTIKIYTIAGDLVRQIQHSDTGGLIAQEKWDAKTTHGDPAASGVYIWRIESSVDSKNGKLMIIR